MGLTMFDASNAHEKTEQSSCFFNLKNYCRPGKAKRRIIGGVVRAPSEAIPVATLDGRERWTWLKRSAENYEGLDNTSARRFTSKMDPMPPVAPSPESKLAWFMAGCSKRRLTLDLIEVHSCLKQAKQKAGPASNGLRQKDSNFATFEHFSTELFLFYVLTLLSLGRNVGINRGEKKMSMSLCLNMKGSTDFPHG